MPSPPPLDLLDIVTPRCSRRLKLASPIHDDSQFDRIVAGLTGELFFRFGDFIPVNHRPQRLPCIILARVLYLPTQECPTSACLHEQNRSSKTEVSLQNQQLTSTIPCHSPQTGSTTVPTTSNMVPATTALPLASTVMNLGITISRSSE